jgi:hypothetical protein
MFRLTYKRQLLVVVQINASQYSVSIPLAAVTIPESHKTSSGATLGGLCVFGSGGQTLFRASVAVSCRLALLSYA